MAWDNILRFKNLFGGDNSFGQSNGRTPPYVPIEPEPRFDESIEAEVEPNISQGRGLDRLYEALGNAPKRGKVGTRGKIGSFMMALGGKSAEDIDSTVHSKYHQAVDEYGNTIKPLIEGAKIESTRMNNASLADYRNTQGQAALGRVANTATGNTIKKTATDAKIKIDEFKSLNPGDKVLEVKGGNYMLVNPVTGAKTDTGIKTGTMTEEEKQELVNEGRMDVVERQGMNQLANTQLAGQNAIVTKETVPGGQKSDTPTQAATRLKNNLQNMRINKPNLVQWIDVDGEGNISVTPPSAEKSWLGNAKGPTEEEYKEIVNLLSNPGTTGLVPPPPPGSVPMTGGDNKVGESPIGGRPDPNDKIKVTKDGKTFMMPRANLAKALERGYKEVR